MNGSVMSPPLSSSDVLIALGLERGAPSDARCSMGWASRPPACWWVRARCCSAEPFAGRSAESHRAAQHDTAAQGDV